MSKTTKAKKSKAKKGGKAGERVANPPKLILLSEITANDCNPRDAVKNLTSQGYDLFPSATVPKEKALWSLAHGTPANRAEYCRLMEEFHPEIVSFGNNMMAVGQLQPIQVKRSHDKITLIYGSVRCLALMYGRLKSGLETGRIKADVATKITNNEATIRAISENMHKVHQDKVDTAKAWSRLVVSGSMTKKQIAEQCGISEGTVENYLELAKAPQEVLDQVAVGEMNMGDAIAVVKKTEEGAEPQEAVQEIEEKRASRKRKKSDRLLPFKQVWKLYLEEDNEAARQFGAKVMRQDFAAAEKKRSDELTEANEFAKAAGAKMAELAAENSDNGEDGEAAKPKAKPKPKKKSKK